MDYPRPFSLRKTFLFAVIASTAVGAIMGIVAVASGGSSSFTLQLILTTTTIALASLCGLACGAYHDSRGARALPISGIALAIIAATMLILSIWTDAVSDYWKATASFSVFAVAFAHLSLLLIARLADRFRWLLAAAAIVIFTLAGLISAVILGPIGEVPVYQWIGVLAILVGAITILIPLFHKFSAEDMQIAGRNDGETGSRATK